MRLEADVTISGNPQVAVFANRLRAAADAAEATAAEMVELGGTPAQIKGGNNVEFTFTVESSK